MNNKLERFKAFLDAKGIAYNATPDETLDLEEAVCLNVKFKDERNFHLIFSKDVSIVGYYVMAEFDRDASSLDLLELMNKMSLKNLLCSYHITPEHYLVAKFAMLAKEEDFDAAKLYALLEAVEAQAEVACPTLRAKGFSIIADDARFTNLK